MYLVGLTGGIGSGKSTAAERFAALGCDVLDVDGVAHDVVQPGEPALEELVARFGRDILLPGGDLDRPRLARLVFNDDDARQDLDRITHPRVAARIAERIQELVQDRRDRGPHLIVVDHPLLVETDQAARFEAVVVVEAEQESRIRRLVERGLPEEDARARVRVQSSDQARRAVATHVIDNDGDLAALHAQVDDVHADLLVRAQRLSAG
ncbi:MAG: dephospho-CoA kinase [Nitriliruptoraceae bacterium]